MLGCIGMLGSALLPVHTWSRSCYCFVLFLTLRLLFEQFGSRVWCSKIKIIKILQSRHISYRGSVGRVSTRACLCLFMCHVCLQFSRSGASPCSCANEKLIKVSGQQLHITERRFCALAGLAPLQLDEQLVQALRMKLSGLARDEVPQSWRSSNRSINKFLGQFGNHFATNSCWV